MLIVYAHLLILYKQFSRLYTNDALSADLNQFVNTRKYPLHGYILLVLKHTTACDQHWGGDEALKLVLIYVAWLRLT